jgi:hypothetical protein
MDRPTSDAPGGNQIAMSTSAPQTRPPRRRRRWLVRLGVLALAAGLLVAFRHPLLRSAAAALVVDQPLDGADCALVLAADRPDREALRLFQDGTVRRILFITKRPNRVVRLSLMPSFERLSERELRKHGVPDHAIDWVDAQAETDWQVAERLHDWLAENPRSRLVAIVERFEGRRWRYVFNKVLGAEDSARIAVHGIPHRHYTEADWWQSKEGVLDFFDDGLGLAYDWINGPKPSTWHETDPQQWLEGAAHDDR